ncbi:potassium-transporting ATPase subunit KdpC [Neobittarella massiliensis]|uniref:Potassium-transporting ATPase KdpC subunit n=1 Tax=Neobittarella massiliensis (ex Bilen et al. 2018) TaxID=2041842 RepID=A0A8J6IJQ6_9FIRM|nr:potassium-transporting ATPase subunit KdpC [Neobittarella massiliensis]MBC3514814.1 potassium-transporting ATPase subunit KdpC [Neobittarella massiliensis]
MKKVLSRAAGLLLCMSLLCGLIYTLAVTGIGQLFFPHQAGGSIIEIDGKTYGSELLGQQFSDDGHLWGRVMYVDVSTFTDENGQPVLYAWASNLSPASDEYEQLIAQRVEKLRAADPQADPDNIPVDLVTCSGSGLDPEISPKAAAYQVPRIAAARGVSESEVQAVIDRYTTGRFLGVFGEERVNVLKVNLALDGILTES